MSRLSEALTNVDAALVVASRIFYEEYPPGKDAVFMWSDGMFHTGKVEQRTSKKFYVFIRSDLTGKVYEVSAQMLVKGEESATTPK